MSNPIIIRTANFWVPIKSAMRKYTDNMEDSVHTAFCELFFQANHSLQKHV